jgi:hypothetical protein
MRVTPGVWPSGRSPVRSDLHVALRLDAIGGKCPPSHSETAAFQVLSSQGRSPRRRYPLSPFPFPLSPFPFPLAPCPLLLAPKSSRQRSASEDPCLQTCVQFPRRHRVMAGIQRLALCGILPPWRLRRRAWTVPGPVLLPGAGVADVRRDFWKLCRQYLPGFAEYPRVRA